MEKQFIQEGIIRSEVESFLRSELSRAGYSGINIQKTPFSTQITLYVEKPPLIIGKKGRRINLLTEVLKDRFGVNNPAIDVQRVTDPSLDPNIVARRIAVALERGMNFRRVAYKALRAVMNSGAMGIEIILAGKLTGKGGKARLEKFSEGYMKKAGDSLKLVNIGSVQAYLRAGVIGVTVKVVPPNTVFPDHIEVIPPSKDEIVETKEDAGEKEESAGETVETETVEKKEKQEKVKKVKESTPDDKTVTKEPVDDSIEKQEKIKKVKKSTPADKKVTKDSVDEQTGKKDDLKKTKEPVDATKKIKEEPADESIEKKEEQTKTKEPVDVTKKIKEEPADESIEKKEVQQKSKETKEDKEKT